MTFNYTAAAATAKRLLTQFGGETTDAQLLRPSADPIFNSSTQEYVIQSSTTDNVNAIRIQAENGLVDGTVIDNNMSVYILDSDVAPSSDDKFKIDGVEYSIVRIIEIKPANVVVAYKLIVKR